MGKRTGRKKITFSSEDNSLSNNYLLGSSADTIAQESSNLNSFSKQTDNDNMIFYETIKNKSNNNKTNLKIMNAKQHQNNTNNNAIHIERDQAYNYAILNDDIVEEAALVSSSEGGYDAELDDSVNSFISHTNSNATDELNAFLENDIPNYMSTDNNQYPDSVISEVSDSILLLEEREAHANIHWYKRPSVFMISLLLFLYTYSIGISMSAQLQLVMTAVCYTYNGGNLDNCSSKEVQQANAAFQKWNNFISSIVIILVSAKLGKLSDIWGRKPIILFSFLMATVSQFLLIFVLTPKYFSFNRLIGTSVIGCLGGSVFVLLGLANSYTIDVVHDKDRLQSLGKVTGCLFLGFSLGPLSSSFLSSTFGIKPITFVAIGFVLMTVSIIIILLFIPESRSVKLRDKSRRSSVRSRRESEVNPTWFYKLGISTLLESFYSLKLLWVSRPINFINLSQQNNETTSDIRESILPSSNNKMQNIQQSNQLDIAARINVLILLTVEILMTLCSVGGSLPIALYLMYTFNLTQSQLGLYVGVSSGLRFIILTFINPWLQHNLLNFFTHDTYNIDFIDVTSISISIICELIATLLCSCSKSVIAICIYMLFSSVSAIGSPVIHSALLKYNSSPGKNGEFFGALALIRNIINLISPLILLSVYSFGLGIGRPQIIFYLIFAIYLIAGFLIGNLRFKDF